MLILAKAGLERDSVNEVWVQPVAPFFHSFFLFQYGKHGRSKREPQNKKRLGTHLALFERSDFESAG